MMTRKVSISSVKASLLWLRRLAAALILFFAAQGVWGQTTYIWTGADVNDNNWSTAGNWRTVNIDGNGNITNVANPATTVPGLDANDVAYIIDNSTITLTGNVTINRLRIANYANPAAAATLNLGTNTLSIGTLNLGNGNNATTNNILQMRGDLSLSNGTVIIGVFDECDNGQNTLELNTVALSITGTVYGNGGGLTTVSGSNSTFDLRNLTGNYNEGEVFSFGSGITVLADKTFWTGRTDSDWTKAENWSTGVPIADSEVVIPANPINPPVLNTATPALKSLTIQSATINDVLKTGTLTLNGSGILNTGTIVNGGEIILSGGTITATTSFTNNKTVTITSGTITNNNVSNGADSTVIYNGTGTQNPIWGNSYQNLEIAAGTSISLGAATIAGTATNNGTLTITSDSFTAGTKSNGSGSKIIYSGNGVTSARWGTSYQDLEIANDTSITLGAVTIAGTATNNGTLTITSNSFSAGTKSNGSASTIIYSGVTAAPWGTDYQNLEIAADSSISLGAATIAGTATNNGTLTITSNSFSAGTKSNGAGSTIIYSGTDFTSVPWDLSYQNLEIAAGSSISLGAATIAGTATNNGTLTITSDSFSAATTSNGTQNSTIIYNGVSTPVWGNSYKNIQINNGTSITFTSAAISGNAVNNGTITISSTISANVFSGAGTITLAGSGGATSLTATNASTQGSIVLDNTAATITGDFSLTSFTATNMAGKSITLNNSTITASSISLSGANGSPLSLNGAGTTHTFDTSSLTADWLSIDSNIILANYTTAIADCVPQADNSLPASWLAVLHNGWNIKALDSFIYTWLGTTSDWNTASNWDTGYVPPTDSRIIIPAVTTPKVYPILPDTADFAGGTLSIASGASVQLGAKNLVLSGTSTPSADILTNSGTIIYTAAGRITNGTNVINDADTTRAGKVQYAAGGTGTITDATNGLEYYDLEVLGSGWSFSGNYKIRNKLTTGTGATGVTENCSVTAVSTIQAATFDFKGPVNFTADLTLAPYDATAVFNIPANLHQKVNTTNKKWLHLGTGATPGNIVFSNDADFSYKLNLHSTATVNAQIQLRNSITATQNINGTGTIEFTGTGDQIFETNGKQFVNIHETKASGKLTINGNPTITTFTTTSNAKGNIIFSNGAAITNGFTQYDGTTTVQGTISTVNSTFSVKDLILSDDAIINTGTGTQAYTTINGTAETEELTLSGTSITLNGNVGGTKKLAMLEIDGTLLIDADCSIKADEIDYSGNIYGNGKTVTLDTPVFKSTAPSPTPGAAAITLKEINFAQANTSIQTQNSTTINLAVQTLNGSGKTITLASTTALSFAGDVAVYPQLATTSGSALTASDGQMTFYSDVNFANCTFTHSDGKIILNGGAADSPQALTTKADGSTSFYDLIINGNVIINNSNIITNLTATGLEGKTITFGTGTTQTVSGALNLSGTADEDNKRLVLTGTSWTLTANGTHSIQYVDVENSTATNTLTALNSYDRGHNVNWNFPGMTYKWTGSNDATHGTEWHFAANWIPSSIPGSGANVTIPADTDDDFITGLVLEADVDISYGLATDKGIITVDGTFDMAGSSVTAAEIINNNLIRANGVTGQSITGKMTNGTTTSTVEYYGTTSDVSVLPWDGDSAATGKQYANLVFNRSVNITGDINVTAGGTITINCASVVSTGAQTYGGAVTIKAGTAALSSTGGNISFVDTVSGNVGTEALTLGGTGVSFAASVTSLAELTVNADISIGTSGIQLAANQITFKGDISAAGKTLTINTPALNSTKVSASSITANRIILSQDTTVTSSNGIILNVPEVSGSGITITNSNALTLGAEINIIPAIVNNGTITCAGTATFNNNYSGSGSLTLSSGTTEFNGDLDLSDASGFTAAGGKVVINPSDSSATVTGPANFHNFELKKSAVINGNNSYNNFTAKDLGNAQITFAAGSTQTVGGILTLKGTKTGNTINYLTLTGTGTGTWNIECSGTNDHDIQYVKVYNSDNHASSYYLTAIDSQDWGGNVKWNFPNQPYEWQGSTPDHKKDWNTAANWTPASIPGKGAQVSIPAGKDDYPLLTVELNLYEAAHPGSITIADGASINLADQKVTVGTFKNFGTVQLLGTGSQSITATMVNGADSTVEYTGTGSASSVLPWDGDSVTPGNQYANLVLNRNVDITGDINVTASGTITIDCASIETSGNQTYSGAVSVVTNAQSISAAGKLITFKSAVTGDEAHSLTVSTADSKFEAAISKLTALTTAATVTFDTNANISQTGTISTNDAVIKCSTISTTDNQTYSGTVSVQNNAILSSTDGMLINFVSTVTGDEAHGLTVSTADSKFEAAISKLTALTTAATVTFDTNANISQTGTISTNDAVIKCSTISTTDNQTYSGTVSVQNNAILSSTDGMLINFVSTVTGDEAHGLTVSTADSKFEAAISKLTALTTAATVTFDTNANISQTGTLSTNNAVIKCSTITTTGTQGYSGAVNLGNDCSLTSSGDIITFSSTINGNQTLTLSVPVAKEINVNGITGGTTPPSITLTQSGSCNFNNSVYIQTFKDFAASGNIFFKNGRINAFDSAVSNTSGVLSFGNAQTDTMTIGTATTDASLTHTAGNTEITGTLKAANITLGTTTGGPMTITNSGLFKTADGNALTYTGSFTQNGTGKNMIGGNFAGDASGSNATFATDTYIYGSAAASLGASGTNITFTKNLSVSRTAALTINAALVSADNILLYKGAVTTNGDLSVAKDIVILGQNYSTTDTTTGIAGEYSYKSTRPAGWSNTNTGYSTATGFEAAMPDTTALPDGSAGKEFNATLSVSGKTITAGKNFYANGTTLSGSSAWTLKVPDLTTKNATDGWYFAEAYFSSINNCNVVCSSDNSTNGTKARLVTLECTDSGTNENVDFGEFKIEEAYTVRDNAVYVRFNREIRYHPAIINSLKFDDGQDPHKFVAFYSDADCTNELNVDILTKEFYIKAQAQDGAPTGAWNTDANAGAVEISSGAANSTDRDGKPHATVPCLDFPRALTGSSGVIPYIITDIWGKRLNNYSQRVTLGASADPAYGKNRNSGQETYVLDHTGPVLYSVRTGQEAHTASTNEANVKSFDSHNFIEFRYSEPVDFDQAASPSYAALNTVPANPEDADQNVQVTDSFGALSGNITAAGTLTFAGLGVIDSGLIYTGRQGNTDKYVNSLYRKDDYSIRISVAGYTDGTVTDNSGYTYKKWIGYIEAATLPSGQVNHLVNAAKKNDFVNDRATDQDGLAAPNPQIKYDAEPANTIPVVNSAVDNSDPTYGGWDTSEPVFAIIRQSKSKPWTQEEFSKNYQAEAIGNNTGVGSTLDRIEFHLYDNTPAFDGVEPEWFTEVGWCNPGSDGIKENNLYKSFSYAADFFGGSKPFAANSPSGGIRYSSLQTSASAFKYAVGSNLADSVITNSFDSTLYVYGTASSLIFTGASNPRRSAQDAEGLYFALPLADTSYDIKTSFTVHYNEAAGFITDLAGNRLRSKTISTIDRTPPSIDMSICPVGADEVEIVFVKELCTDSREINFIKDPVSLEKYPIDEEFEYLISECLDLITIDSSGAPHAVDASDLKFDTSTAAQVWVTKNEIGSAFTHIKLKLSRAVTLQDIKEKYIRVTYVPKYGEESVDLFTQHDGSRVTFIQDENGNTIQMYTAHALSDFAVGEVTPLYAYDSSMVESDGTIISGGLWHTDTSDDVDTQSWSVHDWNRDQQNYGTLPAGHTVSIVADTASASNVNVYLANHPDDKSVSNQANKDFEFTTPWRIWLPDIMSSVFTPLAEKNNTSFAQNSGTLLDGKTNRFIFDLDASIINQWNAGDQVSFLFGITNSDGTPVTIMHSPELDINVDKHYLTTSIKSPLFALRQIDPQDFLSLDLWSFRLKSVIAQRGGVTILNNVIDSAQGEKVVVRVDLPQETNLTVLVMTLDGNIVDYLARGTASKGEHYYSWDGSNRNGKPVARGMYFIRVMSDGIDETRKVLVVKE